MKEIICIIVVAAMFIPFSTALGDETSSYLSGSWGYVGSVIFSIFGIANPTTVTVKVDSAFFTASGTFCGCQQYILSPNGSIVFTMYDVMNDRHFINNNDPKWIGRYPQSQIDECQKNGFTGGYGQVEIIGYIRCASGPETTKECSQITAGNAVLSGWEGYELDLSLLNLNLNFNLPLPGSTFNMKSVTYNSSTAPNQYSIYDQCWHLLAVPNNIPSP